MANQIVNVRCPAPVIELLDRVCDLYGFTRAELLRAGAISYCQQLLITDSLQRLEHLLKASDSLDSDCIQEINSLVDSLSKHLGL